MARLSTRQIRRMFKGQAILHTAKGVPQYVGDSIRGLRWGRRIRKKKADRNTITTRDRVPLNTHYDRPLLHGFHDPTGQFKRFQRITASTAAQVEPLRSKKGNYRINRTQADLKEMGRLGYDWAYIEPKSWINMDNQAIWDLIASWGLKYGVGMRGYTLPGNDRCLPYMNKAGIPAKSIRKRK